MKYLVLFQDYTAKDVTEHQSSPPGTHTPFTREWCFPDPLPSHLDHPAVAVKCAVCEMMQQPVDQCQKYKCCFAQQRRGYEQRRKDDEKNRQEREGSRG